MGTPFAWVMVVAKVCRAASNFSSFLIFAFLAISFKKDAFFDDDEALPPPTFHCT